MKTTTKDSLLSCVTTQLVRVSGVAFTGDDAMAQDVFVDVFDDAMTASMRLLEELIRGFATGVAVRWGNPGLCGQLQVRRGKLEWVDAPPAGLP